MVAEVSAQIAPAAQSQAQAQSWPSRGVAWFGLAAIILATMLNPRIRLQAAE